MYRPALAMYRLTLLMYRLTTEFQKLNIDAGVGFPYVNPTYIRLLARIQNLPSSPSPFSRNWEKGSRYQSPSPKHGRGI